MTPLFENAKNILLLNTHTPCLKRNNHRNWQMLLDYNSQCCLTIVTLRDNAFKFDHKNSRGGDLTVKFVKSGFYFELEAAHKIES